MLTRMGGNGYSLPSSEVVEEEEEEEEDLGITGTGAHPAPSGVRISNPGCPGRWNNSVMEP